MERNKIENDFRQKLNQREITPSANAWDRLDAMLAVAEEKKAKPSYGWMHIAAAIIGFLFIATMFLMQTEEAIDVPRNEVVIENQTSIKSSEVPTEIDKNVNDEKSQFESVAQTETGNTNQNTIKSKIVTKPIKIQNHVAENQSSNQKQIISKAETDNRRPNQKKGEITPIKVDELLATVQPTETVVPKQSSTIKVNANSLLSQVDGELELSFREKVIKNFKTAKVAVANRNLKE